MGETGSEEMKEGWFMCTTGDVKTGKAELHCSPIQTNMSASAPISSSFEKTYHSMSHCDVQSCILHRKNSST